MKKLFSPALLLLSCCGLMISCTTKPKVQEAQLKPIRKVAIVGFTTLSEVPDELEKMAPSTMGVVPNLNTFARQTDTAAKIMKQFMADMQTRMKWTFLPPEQVIDNDAYGDIYAARMKNWKSMMTPDRAYQMHFVKNVLPVAESANFTPDVRDHIMNALKVDALVEVRFKSHMHQPMSINGIGSKAAKSTAMFRVFKRGVAEPVWDDQDAEGEATNKTLGMFGGYNMSKEPELMEMYEEAAKFATIALNNRRDLEDK